MLRERIITAARSYLGTPYLHQGRTRRGLDCIGLVICVVHDCGLSDYDIGRYGRVPSGRMMQRVLTEQCVRIAAAEAGPGDLLHLAFDTQPQHVALITERGMIHADSQHGVVEHGLDDNWRNRVRGAYRLPGVAPCV